MYKTVTDIVGLQGLISPYLVWNSKNLGQSFLLSISYMILYLYLLAVQTEQGAINQWGYSAFATL